MVSAGDYMPGAAIQGIHSKERNARSISEPLLFRKQIDTPVPCNSFLLISSRKKKTKSKPEILKHGGNGGKNRRKQRFFGVVSRNRKPGQPRRITSKFTHESRAHRPNPKKSSVPSGFSSVPSVFQDFWFLTLFFSRGMKM